MSTTVTRLGWIGLGRIGVPMAGRLVKHGFGVVGWDMSPEAVDAAAKLGIEPARSASDVARRADVYFLCLPGMDAVEAVVFGADGLATAASENAVVVDHSTIDPGKCREFAARAARSRIKWVDMPVSGRVDAAEAGELIAWAGGDDEDVATVSPIVSSYVSKLSRMGAAGQGQLAKSCNQMIVGGTVALWSEMLRYATAAGLDPAQMIETLEGGAADSPVSRSFAKALASAQMPEKSIRNLVKDLTAVLNQSTATGFSPKLVRAAIEEFEDHIRSSS